MTMPRQTVAVIGCGVVARARYFPALLQLIDLFDVRALCDTDPVAITRAGRAFPDARCYLSLDLLLDDAGDIDCAVLLTPGDHSQALEILADHALPTLTEKPLAYTVEAATRATDAFERAGVPLHVGYMKRHYEAIDRLIVAIARGDATSVSIDLIHPPEESYLVPVIGNGRAFTTDLPTYLDSEAGGPDLSAHLHALGVPEDNLAIRRAYVLLTTSVIHDVNLIRGLAGEPAEVDHAHFWNAGLCGRITFVWSEQLTGSLTYTYVDTGEYEETIRVVGAQDRWTARLPSPYLANAPAILVTTGGTPTGQPFHVTEPVSFDDPFQLQLRAFHDVVLHRSAPTVDGHASVADHRLIDRIIAAAVRPALRAVIE